jgi:hypothetical protein
MSVVEDGDIFGDGVNVAAARARKSRFAIDSPREGDGFELPVPREGFGSETSLWPPSATSPLSAGE